MTDGPPSDPTPEFGDDAGTPPSDDALYWPAGARYPDSELIDATCDACGQLWRAHRDLAGSALACRCGAAVRFATPPVRVEEHFMAYEGRGAFGDIDAEPGALPDDLSTSIALEPGALVDSHDPLRSRWTSRAMLELVAVMFAFLAPALAVMLFAEGELAVILQPLASVGAALLVLLIGATARRYTFAGLRPASPFAFLEGAAVGLVGAAAAIGFIYGLSEIFHEIDFEAFEEYKDLLGMAMTLFVIAFCPAVFEELAFRGLLQGRMTALFGNWMGIFITAVTFALAHGLSIVTLFHLGIGVYLGWLRWRTDSLLPGMLLHFTYNGTIVVAM